MVFVLAWRHIRGGVFVADESAGRNTTQTKKKHETNNVCVRSCVCVCGGDSFRLGGTPIGDAMFGRVLDAQPAPTRHPQHNWPTRRRRRRSNVMVVYIPLTSSSSMVVLESVDSFTCDPSLFLVIMLLPARARVRAGDGGGGRG